MLMKIRYSKKG